MSPATKIDPAEATAQVALAWKILYDEPYEEVPDPNKPENIPYSKAMKKQKQEALQQFLDGPGKPLLEEWQKRIKGTNLQLLFGADVYKCTCDACLLIRDIRNLLLLMQEMRQTLEDKKPKQLNGLTLGVATKGKEL